MQMPPVKMAVLRQHAIRALNLILIRQIACKMVVTRPIELFALLQSVIGLFKHSELNFLELQCPRTVS